MKIVIGDLNARIGREEMYRPVIGPYSLDTGSKHVLPPERYLQSYLDIA